MGLPLSVLAFATVLTGCGSSSSAPPKKTPTPTRTPVTHVATRYTSVSFFGPRLGMVTQPLAAGTRVWKTTNGGKAWRKSTASMTLNDIQLRGRNLAFALASVGGCSGPGTPGCRSGIVTTSNGGRSWSWVFRPPAPLTVATFGFRRARVGWAVVDSGTDYAYSLLTTNGGASWRHVLTKVGGIGSLEFVSPRKGFATTTPSRAFLARIAANPGLHQNGCQTSLLETVNGGRTWVKRLHFKHRCAAFIDFLSRVHGWLLLTSCHSGALFCHQGLLLETLDGGKRWARLWSGSYSSSTDDVLNGIHFVNPSVGWIPSGDSARPLSKGVLVSTDGGRSWTDHLGAWVVQAAGIAPVNATQGWVIGSLLQCRQICSALFHTVNGGLTWKRAVLGPRPPRLIYGRPDAVVARYFPANKPIKGLTRRSVRINRLGRVRHLVRLLNHLHVFQSLRATCSATAADIYDLRFVYRTRTVLVVARVGGCSYVYHPGRKSFALTPPTITAIQRLLRVRHIRTHR